MKVTEETLQKLKHLGVMHINIREGHELTEEAAQELFETISKMRKKIS